MGHWDDMMNKLRTMHTTNFIFWVFGKFLGGLGLGILLATYIWNPLNYWIVAGWIILAFAVITQLPAIFAVFSKKK